MVFALAVFVHSKILPHIFLPQIFINILIFVFFLSTPEGLNKCIFYVCDHDYIVTQLCIHIYIYSRIMSYIYNHIYFFVKVSHFSIHLISDLISNFPKQLRILHSGVRSVVEKGGVYCGRKRATAGDYGGCFQARDDHVR